MLTSWWSVKSILRLHIWSAIPTPLTPDLAVDIASVRNLVRDAVEHGIEGLFLAGTCGEGPWLPDRERQRLVAAVAAAADGRLKLAVQATDNSVPRILDNIRQVADAGADYAIIAPPAIFMNATPERVASLFMEAAEASTLPVGIYDLGRHRPVQIPEDKLLEVYLQPNVRLIKDSSGSPSRRQVAIAAREAKPGMVLFNGDEFNCLTYLQAGYDGLMFGGLAAVPRHLRKIVTHFTGGRLDEARRVEADMVRTLTGIYGGPGIPCWLSGLKYCLMRRGTFASTASFLDYPLSAECRAFIDDYVSTEDKSVGVFVG
jgi:4-hydroxy-tetrahydrodipicolinate synthase